MADAKLALSALKDQIGKQVDGAPSVADSPIAKEIAAMVEEWRREFAPQMDSDAVPVRTPRLIREIQRFVNEDTIAAVDAGGCSYWAPPTST